MLMQTPYFQALPATLSEFSSARHLATLLAANAGVVSDAAGQG